MATAAARTTNPLLLGLVIAVTGWVVAARRSDAPWAGAYRTFLRLSLVVVAVRVVMGVLLADPIPGHVLFTPPQVPLPDWLAGLRLGGPVTAETVLAGLYQGMQLATILVCAGAANALANPRRLVKAVPAGLYEVGVAVTVALSFAPQAITSVGRVRAARRLRGRPTSGLAGLRGTALPVLVDALDRSVALAAAMDSRGFGRRADVPAGRRRLTSAAILAGLVAAAAGTYGLLGGGTPATLGLPLLAAGAALAVGGLWLGSARSPRTRYRPDPWRLPEWATTGSGLAAGAVLVGCAVAGLPGLSPPVSPLGWPTLPALAAAGILAGLIPAVATPRPVRVAPARPLVAAPAGPTPASPTGSRTPVGEAARAAVAGDAAREAVA